MEFEWDERKHRANFEKHGIDFYEAKTVWADSFGLEFFDSIHSVDEDRFIRIGRSMRHKLVTVVFAEPSDGQIRIISARLTTLRERRLYEEGI